MSTITVIGLGPGDLAGLSLGTWELIQSGTPLFLRTEVHPAAADLRQRNIPYTSFDALYETIASFDLVYQTIVSQLLDAAVQTDILYAVPGHPLMAEQSVQWLLEQAHQRTGDVAVRIGPGQSFLDAVFTALRIDPIQGVTLLDAINLRADALNPAIHTLIAQVYQPAVATDVKLTLMDVYPDEYVITVIRAAGVHGAEQVVEVPLYQLDRLPWIDHLTTVFVPATTDAVVLSRHANFPATLVERLRAPDGCPWDRKQTHNTLRQYVLEEAYEVAQAIDDDDGVALADELGDLLLQVLLHAQIGAEVGEFTVRDVYAALSAKLIRRHPHVFGNFAARSEEDAQARWDAAKQMESPATDDSSLRAVKRGQPPFVYALALQHAAAAVGMDWAEAQGAVNKLGEELSEFVRALQPADAARTAAEFGDLLFTMTNVARWLQIDPERALLTSADTFAQRFRRVEQRIREEKRIMKDCSAAELDRLWKQAKADEPDNLSE